MVAFDSSTIHHGLDGQELACRSGWRVRTGGLGVRDPAVRAGQREDGRSSPTSAPGTTTAIAPTWSATLKGTGNGRSLILNGHVDTMPAGDRAKWTHDPWGGEIDDGEMYGLGVCDMKAGVAAMILATRFLCEAGVPAAGRRDDPERGRRGRRRQRHAGLRGGGLQGRRGHRHRADAACTSSRPAAACCCWRSTSRAAPRTPV